MKWRSPQPVYVVGGFYRSGTTMMMQALEAGGLKADRAPKGDPLRDLYELDMRQKSYGWYSETDETDDLPIGERFPAQHRGHVIKALIGSAKYMDIQPAGTKVVFMLRDPREIRESSGKFFGHPYRIADIERAIRDELNRWRMRSDTELIEMNYTDVLANPELAFSILKQCGWPINVKKAARVVDPAKRTVAV